MPVVLFPFFRVNGMTVSGVLDRCVVHAFFFVYVFRLLGKLNARLSRRSCMWELVSISDFRLRECGCSRTSVSCFSGDTCIIHTCAERSFVSHGLIRDALIQGNATNKHSSWKGTSR